MAAKDNNIKVPATSKGCVWRPY